MAKQCLMRAKYEQEVMPQMLKTFGYKNVMQIPRLTKIVVNMGLGEAIANNKVLDTSVEELKLITGQKPVITKSTKSIAAFKLRQGMSVGAMVTLRRSTMYEFFNRLVNISLPRVRDFQGLPRKGFDGKGNYTLGLREQIIFPEIDYDKVEKIRGMNISFVTTARTDEECLEMLLAFGMPFKKK
ncbi:MAG: 50S ribosomal protein L5 [Deltaproteobacteria bacterium RIFOXYA12_FULL_61_11]|nr:MAG: 50S ribosomal protein L5 [Deltaproteobacteria bacterium RIFOXYA12_FULL_61_11]